MSDPTEQAREAAERIMSKLRWGEPLTRLLPSDIASAVRGDIEQALLLAFRVAALEEAADFVEDERNEECGRWLNGRLAPSCSKAGSEECDFECPYR